MYANHHQFSQLLNGMQDSPQSSALLSWVFSDAALQAMSVQSTNTHDLAAEQLLQQLLALNLSERSDKGCMTHGYNAVNGNSDASEHMATQASEGTASATLSDSTQHSPPGLASQPVSRSTSNSSGISSVGRYDAVVGVQDSWEGREPMGPFVKEASGVLSPYSVLERSLSSQSEVSQCSNILTVEEAGHGVTSTPQPPPTISPEASTNVCAAAAKSKLTSIMEHTEGVSVGGNSFPPSTPFESTPAVTSPPQSRIVGSPPGVLSVSFAPQPVGAALGSLGSPLLQRSISEPVGQLLQRQGSQQLLSPTKSVSSSHLLGAGGTILRSGSLNSKKAAPNRVCCNALLAAYAR